MKIISLGGDVGVVKDITCVFAFDSRWFSIICYVSVDSTKCHYFPMQLCHCFVNLCLQYDFPHMQVCLG
jgi:hypothetical protein